MSASDLAFLPGVGQQRAELLKKLGIQSREQLLFHLPRRYEDRRRFIPLAQAQPGEDVTLRGKIHSVRSQRWRGGRKVLEVVVASESITSEKDVLRCLWFNVHYLQNILVKGREVIFHGKPSLGKNGWTMVHPEFEVVEDDDDEFIHLNRITPIYPLTEGLSQRVIRRILFEATQRDGFEYDEFYPAPKEMPLLKEAIPAVHFPESWEQKDKAWQRIVYDEFFCLQCVLAQRRNGRKKIEKKRGQDHPELAAEFLSRLPFPPTRAQERVMREIATDLHLPVPMNRLLQGDVGSGKTVVAVYAMLMVVGQGEQAALMAPTEILAEQHYLNLKRWLEPLGISVGLHTGSKKISDRSPMDQLSLKQSLFQGRGSIVVGTHALLYDSFVTDQLGLVVIDEQHKFGVLQRLSLVKKGKNPDILVMTATPIPRTLGMTLYGDLDVSVIDELPPGRSPIVTACRSAAQLERVWMFIRQQLDAGRQAYIVYPLIEESEKVEAKAVEKEFEQLKKTFRAFEIGLLHGRMKPEEKEKVMTGFRSGKIQVLVSTAVIEVGVDVPNATIMVIENAERFGLAQLHQLRGRVGRGSEKSYCVLVGEPKSKESWQRLKIMEETNDGFRIAEEDLKIRGPGNIFGTEQSGLPPLRFGNLVRDMSLLAQARNDAEALVRRDPTLKGYPLLRGILEKSIPHQKSLASIS